MNGAEARPGEAGAVWSAVSAADTARAFRHLEWWLLRNTTRTLLSGSRLRVMTIAVCSGIFWTGLFVLFFEGFRFLGEYMQVTSEIVERIFGVFYLSLLVMLLVSTAIILYAGLFRSREAAYLLSLPAPSDQIFAHKFMEAMAFSSWAFLLLGSPLMVAYGINSGSGWPFYPLFVAFHVAFVLIPGGLGAMVAVAIAMLMPRQRKTVLGVAGGLLAAGVGYAIFRVWTTPGEALSSDWMNSLVDRLGFSSNQLLPSRWLAAGLLHSARGEWRDGLFYLMVVGANAGMAYLVAAVVARDLYRTAYSRVLGGRAARKHRGLYVLDRGFHRLFPFLSPPIRLLILKDLRTFRRDPTQWSQFLIFFSLLAFYFVNIRRLGYNVQSDYFRNLLSYLNLAVTALILSTFTSRFIFPMLSLEGRNFWVLGLLPVRRSSILWGKFVFSAGITLLATELLIVLSDLMLRIRGPIVLLHMGMVAVLCLGLSGISVGLGARLPNLREEDPSKIAAGFGGTLNLLVSLVFIFLVIAPAALLSHLYFASRGLDAMNGLVANAESLQGLWVRLSIAGAASLVVGLLAVVIPLRIGIRAFERMEL